MTKKICYILFFLCFCIMPYETLAQTNDDLDAEKALIEEQTRKNAILQNTLDSLTAKKKLLLLLASEKKKGSLGDSISEADNTIKALEEKIENWRKKGRAEEMETLRTAKEKLLLSIETLKAEQETLLQEFRLKSSALEELEKRNEEIESFEQEFATRFIADRSPLVSRALSIVGTEELSKARKECEPYLTNSAIKALYEDLGTTLKAKELMNEVMDALQSPFNQEKVDKAKHCAETLKTGEAEGVSAFKCSEEQATDLNSQIQALSVYREGLATLQKLIKDIDEETEVGRKNADKEQCLDYIKANVDRMSDKIAATTEKVPYLKSAYTQYLEALRSNPTESPRIQEEILKQ